MKLKKEGYFFEFSPAKQKVKHLKDFLVPIGTIEFEIFNTYKTVLFSELDLEQEDRMWIRGVAETANLESYFHNSPIGRRKISDIAAYIAEQLGYPEEEAKLFTGHSFRHSGATWLADSGVSNMQLQKKLNHKNPKVIHVIINIRIFLHF